MARTFEPIICKSCGGLIEPAQVAGNTCPHCKGDAGIKFPYHYKDVVAAALKSNEERLTHGFAHEAIGSAAVTIRQLRDEIAMFEAESSAREKEIACLSREDARLRADLKASEAEVERLQALVNTPTVAPFLEAVKLEAAHQRHRWGKKHDQEKDAFDWMWLVAHLSTKAARAHQDGDMRKAMHHTVSSAAVLSFWHAQIDEERPAPTSITDISIEVMEKMPLTPEPRQREDGTYFGPGEAAWNQWRAECEKYRKRLTEEATPSFGSPYFPLDGTPPEPPIPPNNPGTPREPAPPRPGRRPE